MTMERLHRLLRLIARNTPTPSRPPASLGVREIGEEIGAKKNISYVLSTLAEYGYIHFRVEGRKQIPTLSSDGWWLFTQISHALRRSNRCPLCNHRRLLMTERLLSALPFFTPTLRPLSPHDYDMSALCIVHAAEVKGLLRRGQKSSRRPKIHRETQEVRP